MSALPRSVLLAAACAPGKRIVVSVGAVRYDLPRVLQQPQACAADPVHLLAAQLAERDEAARAEAAAAEERMRASNEAVAGLVRQATEASERLIETLMLPVVPTGYDKQGRIIAAQRKRG